ncbi:unnamed protein product [Amoebophrya sp. A120]|nr:unnamed protein product [Amoebophrya sp. A120]|eukprot:GSA120T00005800001.1
MASGGAHTGVVEAFERNHEATIYVGNIDAKIDEDVLWELFLQVGPLQSVHTPKDKITGVHLGYAFVEFKNEDDAEYACKVMNMVKLFNKPIRCTKSSADRKTQDVGANLFIGNLDIDCEDKTLYDTFASFGHIVFAKIMRNPDPPYESRGFAFVSFDSFDSSDAAMAAMNGQFLANSPINVSYAYKKDTRGERHGDAAERLIAAYKPQQIASQYLPAPETLASGQGLAIPNGPAPMIRGGVAPGVEMPGAGKGTGLGTVAGAPPPFPGTSKNGGMGNGGKQWGKGW